MKKIIKSYVSLAISLFLITGCSSGNPTTPNKANLTNLTKMPSTTPENEIKKVNLSGRVIDSVTRKPIENASILVYAISNEDVMKSVKSGLKPDVTNSASPANGVSGSTNTSPSPSPSASIVPDSQVTPSIIPMSPSIAPIMSSNPAPIEENEEKIIPSASVKPFLKNIGTPPKPASKNLANTTSVLPVGSPAVSPSASPSDSATSAEEEKDISTDTLVSALTNLKLNDLTEFEGKTGNDGKFWINKVPDTNIIITINANNYRSTSIFNADISKAEDIVLERLDNKQNYSSIIGSVVSATNNSVDNAIVSPSYVVGESFAIPVATNSMGDFRLDDLSIGERSLFATVKDETGKIVSMGSLDFDVKKGNKLPPLPTPSVKPKIEVKPTIETEPEKTSLPDQTKRPSTNKSLEKSPYENEEEVKLKVTPSPVVINDKKPEVKKDKNIPVIKIKAVTDYINLKGKITSSESNTLKSINVYLTFKKKGMPKEEVFLTDKQVDGTADSFDLSLPKLESGYAYHLEFVAVNKKGTYIYHHEYNLKKDEKEIKVSFLPPVSIGRTDFIDKDGEKLPVFSWPSVEGAGFYRVTLDKVDKDNNITTLWQGVTPFSTAVYPISTGSSKLNSGSTYYWSVEAIKESANGSSVDKLQFSKASINSWSDLSHSPNMEFKLNGGVVDEQVEEIDRKKEGQ